MPKRPVVQVISADAHFICIKSASGEFGMSHLVWKLLGWEQSSASGGFLWFICAALNLSAAPHSSWRLETYYVLIWKQYINGEAGCCGVFAVVLLHCFAAGHRAATSLIWMFNYDNGSTAATMCFLWTLDVINLAVVFVFCIILKLFKSLLAQDQNNLVSLSSSLFKPQCFSNHKHIVLVSKPNGGGVLY